MSLSVKLISDFLISSLLHLCWSSVVHPLVECVQIMLLCAVQNPHSIPVHLMLFCPYVFSNGWLVAVSNFCVLWFWSPVYRWSFLCTLCHSCSVLHTLLLFFSLQGLDLLNGVAVFWCWWQTWRKCGCWTFCRSGRCHHSTLQSMEWR